MGQNLQIWWLIINVLYNQSFYKFCISSAYRNLLGKLETCMRIKLKRDVTAEIFTSDKHAVKFLQYWT